MTNEEKRKLFDAMKKPIPGPLSVAKVIEHLIAVLGLGGHRIHRSIECGATAASAYEAQAEVTLEIGTWLAGQYHPWADVLGDGQCIAATEFQAKLGAYEAALLNAASHLGISAAAQQQLAPVLKLTESPLATVGQLAAIKKKASLAGYSAEVFAESVVREYKVPLEQLSRGQASKLLSKLNEAKRRGAPSQATR